MFRSVCDRIHSVYTGPVRNWNGTVPYGITFKRGLISYHIEDPIHTVSRVNTRLIRTNFVPFQTNPVPRKRCLICGIPKGSNLYLGIISYDSGVLCKDVTGCDGLQLCSGMQYCPSGLILIKLSGKAWFPVQDKCHDHDTKTKRL